MRRRGKDHVSRNVLVVGAGQMGVAYTRVLRALGFQPKAVCRSIRTAENYTKQTGLPAFHGGLDAYLAAIGSLPDEAIVAVDVDQLASTTEEVIRNGARRILVEKPGGLNLAELERMARTARRASALVAVGYNRRFYAATQRALELIAEDGGIATIIFDFTERSRVVEQSRAAPAVKAAWLLANSSHVIDLAFFLAGAPIELQARVHGSLPWHPRGSRYLGIGRAAQGATFAYYADWQCPGGWSVDIRTLSRRLLLCPLETLKVQNAGEFELKVQPLDDTLDREYKPGLFRQVQAFLTGERKEILLSLDEQIERVRRIYEPVAEGQSF